MFGLFKKSSPADKLNKLYLKKMEEARDALRGGDVKANALLTAEAEKIADEIQKLKK